MTVARKLMALFSLLAVAGFLWAGAVRAQGSDEILPHIDAQEFAAQIARDDKAVLIQFDASWCPYCKALRPHLESLARMRQADVEVFRVDVDEEQGLAEDHDVKGLPTMIVFRKGKTLGRYDGVADEAELSDWLDDVLR